MDVHFLQKSVFLKNLPVRGMHNEHCDWGCHITITLLLRKSEVCQYTEAPKSQLLKRKIAATAGNWIQLLDFWSKSNSRHIFNLISIFHSEMAAGIGSNIPKTELDKRWRKRMAGWMHGNISHSVAILVVILNTGFGENAYSPKLWSNHYKRTKCVM